MEDCTKAVFAFSKLTEINSRRSARYTSAADRVKNIHLKIIFMNYAFQAQQLNADLRRWISAYGVPAAQNAEGYFSAMWSKVREVFSFSTEDAVFNLCEELEEEALKNYVVYRFTKIKMNKQIVGKKLKDVFSLLKIKNPQLLQ